MTTKQIEEVLSYFNCMVHGVKSFAPGQNHKLIWEDVEGNKQTQCFTADTIKDLVVQITAFIDNKRLVTEESDLIINYNKR